MTKNIKMMSKIGGLGLAGTLAFGLGQVQAADFPVSVTVQNTLDVTIVQDMAFGTLFASGANSSAVDSITLAPDGVLTENDAIALGGVVADAPAFLSLGGEAAARGSVTSNESTFILTVPSGTLTGLAPSSGTFDENEGVEISLNADANEPAFYLTDFIVGDAPDADVTPITAGQGTYTVDPNFGISIVEFGIGATIVTDGTGASNGAYQETIYSGTFPVTASF